jgi:hypothetical protein
MGGQGQRDNAEARFEAADATLRSKRIHGFRT